MTKLGISTAFGIAIGLFAETGTPSNPIEQWGSLSALGIVAVVLIYIVTKHLPDIIRQHAADLQKAHEMFADELKREREAHGDEIKAMVGELKESRDAVLDVVRRCEAGRKTGG